jgi:gamma-glutamyltranspeptidase/glutathione hydrolase
MAATINKVALATTSQLAADAAAEIASLGGNAVDCAIAAAMCSINTQPGVCALAGSAFITIWEAGKAPVTFDGNVLIPGCGLPEGTTPVIESVRLEYGGGIETLVGASSIAVPGTLAAIHAAAEKYGELPWREVLQPTIRATREGFPLATACHYFLGFAGDVIYGRSDDGYRALHFDNGQLRDAGSTVVVPHLSDTLTAIADEGQAVFYQGYIGKRIAEHVQSRGGLLTIDDLKNYVPEIRPSLTMKVGEWQIATNPPPAIGGANLVAMLLAFGSQSIDGWDEEALRRLVDTQRAVMSYRQKAFATADDVAGPIADLLDMASSGEFLSRWASGSTVHTSAVDGNGLACSITASSGYGSGEMPDDTGLWLNNCLGELELNVQGVSAGPPGKRLPSNMAPGAARSGQRVLAFGSPGADRITTALHQFLVNFAQLGLDLKDAVAHPRLHLILDGKASKVAVEPGLDLPDLGIPISRYPAISMYFGGVVAALADHGGVFATAADPRREGGTYIGPDSA